MNVKNCGVGVSKTGKCKGYTEQQGDGKRIRLRSTIDCGTLKEHGFRLNRQEVPGEIQGGGRPSERIDKVRWNSKISNLLIRL